MTPTVTLRRALEDPNLLGSALAGPSWATWRAILLAAMGEELKPDELELFSARTGRDQPPGKRVQELWGILEQLIEKRTADTLSLTTGIDLEVRAANFRRVRGMTS